MVKEKPKVKAIGAPFDICWSSCSNEKPELFDWTTENSDLSVYIDYAIVSNLNNIIKKERQLNIGWLCESITISANLYNFVKTNYRKIFSKFDYIFTSDKYLLSLDGRFRFSYSCSNIPWLKKEKWAIYPKNKLCSMISSTKEMCPLHIKRQEIADKFYNKLDLFGGYKGSPTTGKKYDGFYEKDNALKDYMFTLVVQNNDQPYFFAELLTDCFAYGTIPVYLGNPEIGKFFNSDGIITLNEDFNFDILTKDLYYSKMNAIQDNLNKIKEMPMSDDYLYNQYIYLLENL